MQSASALLSKIAKFKKREDWENFKYLTKPPINLKVFELNIEKGLWQRTTAPSKSSNAIIYARKNQSTNSILIHRLKYLKYFGSGSWLAVRDIPITLYINFDMKNWEWRGSANVSIFMLRIVVGLWLSLNDWLMSGYQKWKIHSKIILQPTLTKYSWQWYVLCVQSLACHETD